MSFNAPIAAFRFRPKMIDLAIGMVGLALVIVAPLLVVLLPHQPRLSGRCLVLGAIIVGGCLGTVQYPEHRTGDKDNQRLVDIHPILLTEHCQA
jgi:hypothetical protein